MKVFNSVHDFDYSWDEVSTANWCKYCPWNKYSSHVIAVDTLSRELNKDSGVLKTERLLTCKQAAPKWIKPFLGSAEVSYVYEVSYITPPRPASSTTTAPAKESSTTTKTKTVLAPSLINDPNDKPRQESQVPTISMTSVNLTWSDLLRVHERVTYTPSPLDPTHKTRFEQQASIIALCGGWARVRDKIEGFTVERFGQNAERGRKGFESVLKAGREKGGFSDA